MAKKHARWSAQKYKEVVAGNEENGIIGLRAFFNGFDAKDGFSLRSPEKWTKYQKEKVREAFHRSQLLQAQPVFAVKSRGKKLKKLQEILHGDISSKGLKVAFVPTPHFPILSGKEITNVPPQIEITDYGILTKFGMYSRPVIFFNKKQLALDPENEIKRCASLMPDGVLYYHIRTGAFESVAGQSMHLDAIIDKVTDYMIKYDGKKPLPDSSGNRGDDPQFHKWDLWLDGIIGYINNSNMSVKEMRRMIKKGREQNEERRRKMMNYLKRKGRKK